MAGEKKRKFSTRAWGREKRKEEEKYENGGWFAPGAREQTDLAPSRVPEEDAIYKDFKKRYTTISNWKRTA